MPLELRASTGGRRALVALAERLAEDLATRAAAHDRDGSFPFESIDALRRGRLLRGAGPGGARRARRGLRPRRGRRLGPAGPGRRLDRDRRQHAPGRRPQPGAPLADGRASRRRAPRAARSAARCERSPRGDVVIAAAISEPGQDLTRPATTRGPHGGRLADRRPQDLLHDVAGGDDAARRRWASSTRTAASATATSMIPRDAPGVTINDDWDALGMRASGSHSVTFDGVELPAEALRGGFPAGEPVAVHGAQPPARACSTPPPRSASPRRRSPARRGRARSATTPARACSSPRSAIDLAAARAAIARAAR